jgi:hypothetical protein
MSTGAERDRVTEAWPQLYARIAGGLYLIVIVGGIFAEIFVRGRLVVHGDAAATAQTSRRTNCFIGWALWSKSFIARVIYPRRLFSISCSRSSTRTSH